MHLSIGILYLRRNYFRFSLHVLELALLMETAFLQRGEIFYCKNKTNVGETCII